MRYRWLNMFNKNTRYIRPKIDDVYVMLKNVPNTNCENDKLVFYLANLDQVSMCSGWNEQDFNDLLAKHKIDLSELTAGEKISTGLNREQTKQRVLEMLSEVITKDSKMTKGALIKYIRENFKEQTVYSDVGKVASKVISENTGHSFSKWQVCTTQRHIRKVK